MARLVLAALATVSVVLVGLSSAFADAGLVDSGPADSSSANVAPAPAPPPTGEPTQPDDEPTTTGTSTGPVTMTVHAGLDGLIAPDTPLVVDVELASQVLVVGTLELDFRGATAVAVEVPAGGVKEYRLESPGSGGRTLTYTVTLRDEAGDDVTSYTGRVRQSETEVVALLGIDGIDTAIRSARTTPLQRTPEVIRLEPDQIDPRIAPVGYVVAGPGALGRLSDEARLVLDDWVRDGGRLFAGSADLAEIAEPTGDTLLAGTGITLTRLGRGELGLVTDPTAVTPDQWGRVIRDTAGGLDIVDSAEMGFEGGLVVAASSGQEAAVPALPWLLSGILLFIVLVGPVNMLVLRAVGKPEWSWVTIPVLSLLFLGGFWIVGKSQILDYTANHASVVVDDGRARAVADTGLLIQVASAGEHVLALEEGWQAFPAGTGSGTAMAEGLVEDRTVVFDLDDLGLGVTRVRWDTDRVGLDATVAPHEDGFEVTVANNTPWTLDTWGVVVDGRGFGSPDPLGPGETGSVTVVAGRASLPEPAIVSASMSSGGFDYEVVRLLGGHLESTWPVLETDTAYAFGVTSGRMVEVDMDGRAAQSPGTTLLVRRFEVDDVDLIRLGSTAPELLAVDGASTVERYGEEVYAYGADTVVLLYTVPGGLPDSAAVGRVGSEFTIVEIWDWDEGGWVPFGWERAIDPAKHLSAGGEMLVRASVEDRDAFVDRPMRMQQFSLRWTA